MLVVSSAESLLNTVWLNNTIHFGMCGCQEHRDLCWCNVNLCKDARMQKVTKFLVYTERQTKTLGLQLTPRTSERLRRKCFQLTVNKILWSYTKCTVRSDRIINDGEPCTILPRDKRHEKGRLQRTGSSRHPWV